MKLRIQGSESGISSPGFHFSGSGFRVQGLLCVRRSRPVVRASGCVLRISGAGLRFSVFITIVYSCPTLRSSAALTQSSGSSGLRFRVSVLGPQISDFGFRVSSFGFWSSGFGSQNFCCSAALTQSSGSWDFGFRVSGVNLRFLAFKTPLLRLPDAVVR